MVTPLFRVQVDYFNEGFSHALNVEDPELTDDEAALVAEIVDRALASSGLPWRKAAVLLVAEAVRQHFDAVGYRAECERRGVLAL